jgi:hypothetical protein
MVAAIVCLPYKRALMRAHPGSVLRRCTDCNRTIIVHPDTVQDVEQGIEGHDSVDLVCAYCAAAEAPLDQRDSPLTPRGREVVKAHGIDPDIGANLPIRAVALAALQKINEETA